MEANIGLFAPLSYDIFSYMLLCRVNAALTQYAC